MGIIDKLLGREEPAQNQNAFQNQNAQPAQGFGAQPQQNQQGAPGAQVSQPMDADAQAVARYRYMLQTAPPEQIEAAHAEAFSRLTPEQRKLALQQIAQTVPENERANLQDDPRSLAQAATRAEIRQPGTLQNAFGNQGQPGGGMGGGMMGGMGGMLAGSLLASVAGGFIGSSIAHSFFSNPANESGFAQDAQAQGLEPAAYDSGDPYLEQPGHDSMGDPADSGSQGFQEAGNDSLGDPGASDAGAFDGGGFDGGDFGGDFGGFDI